MIAKITSGSDFFGLINYNINKIEKGEGKVIGTNNLVSNNPTMWVKLLNEDAEKNTKIKKPTFHVSLNLPPKEKLSNEKFFQIAKEYMKGMGYGEQPFAVFEHTDTLHSHIHIVSSRIKSNGEKIKDSFEKRRSMEITRKLEEKHNLTIVDSSKKKETLYISSVDKIKGNKSLVRSQISHVLDYTLKKYKLTDIDELRKTLIKNQVGLEKLSGESSRGEKWEGLVYYLTDKNENQVTQSIAASKIHYKPTIKKLDIYFEKSKKIKKEIRKPTANKIIKILDSYKYISSNDFIKRLDKVDIEVFYAKNKTGIYGVSFLDKKKGVIFKGSELNKELSWNKIKEKLNEDLTITNKEIDSMINKAYYQLRRENLSSCYFESQLLSAKKDEITELLKDKLKNAHPLLKEELNVLIIGFVAKKMTNIPKIKEQEAKHVDYYMNEGVAILAELIHADENRGYKIFDVLNLGIKQEKGKNVLHHLMDESLNKKINDSELKILGLNTRRTNNIKIRTPLKKAIRCIVNRKEKPPVLFFTSTNIDNILNEKGIQKFNEIQNQQYLNEKINIFKKKKISIEQQMESLIYRGIVPEFENDKIAKGYFYNLDPKISSELPKELIKIFNKKKLLKIAEKIQRTNNLHERLALNHAIDKNDLREIQNLSQKGIKPILPQHEIEMLSDKVKEALTTPQGIFNLDLVEKYFYDISMEFITLIPTGGAGEEAIGEDETERRKKKRRKKTIN